jgi:hypothetical protein
MLGTGDPLATYLNDHLAGATAGLDLARRLADDEGPLAAVAEEIAEDRQALIDVMERLSVGQSRIKVALGWGAEKVLRYSPASRLEELEALSLGVEGKLALWRALRHTYGSDPRLDGVDLDDLIARGQSQRRRLERQRMTVAEEALGRPPSG